MKPTTVENGGAAEGNSEPTRIEWLKGRRVDEISRSTALHLPKFVRYPEASKRATELRASMQLVDLDEPGDGRRVIIAIALQLEHEGYRRADGKPSRRPKYRPCFTPTPRPRCLHMQTPWSRQTTEFLLN